MIIIKNGKILTMTNLNIEDGYILIDNGKIKIIGTKIEELDKKVISKCEIIDAKGKYILPGLIDAHCHVGIWEDSVGFEGADGNEDSDPITPHLRALDAIYHLDRAFKEARDSGVTTVVTGPGSANVIGGQFVALKTYGATVDEMVLKDFVAMKIALGENPKTVYSEKKQMPTTRMGTAALLRETFIKANEYLDLVKTYENDKEDNDKPEYDMRLEALIPVIKGEIPLKIHAHRSDDIITGIRIAKEFNLKYTIEHCTDGYLVKDTLIKENVQVVIGPILSDRSKVELRNQNIKNPKILSDAGLEVSLITDHPVIPIQYLSLCAAIATKEGMNQTEALKSITINPARATGISDRVGSLEVGKDADIVIYDGHPFEIMTKVDYTLINGSVVYKRENND